MQALCRIYLGIFNFFLYIIIVVDLNVHLCATVHCKYLLLLYYYLLLLYLLYSYFFNFLLLFLQLPYMLSFNNLCFHGLLAAD